MGNFWNQPVKPNQTSLEEDNWTKRLREVLLENIQPLEAAENTTGTVTKVKQIGLDPGNPLIKADVSKRFPQYLKFKGGPTLLSIRISNLIFV
jgi:hypothetical protein